MTLLTSAVGLFYVLAACLVLRGVHAEMSIDQAAVKHSMRTLPDQVRTVLMMLSACLYAVAGVALLAASEAAVWLFAGALAMQGLGYGLIWRLTGSSVDNGNGQWNQAWIGGILSAAALALSAYDMRMGILT